MPDFTRQWIATLTRATPAYWWSQGLVAVVSIFFGVLMLDRLETSVDVPMLGFCLRAGLDALLFFVVSHVGIRPALRLHYMNRNPGWLAWLGLAAWLLALVLASMLVGLAVDRMELTSMSTITAVRFEAGEDQMGFDLQGGPMYAFVLINLWLTYVVWAALYLGWQAMQQRRRLQRQVQEARMAQLTHQLNPHFLFNAFNTIRGTIFESPHKAAELVTELSELFRFHLSQSERSTHTLAEEWRLAQRYLAIEQARLEQRLKVRVELDRSCLERQVPSLALLSLIENAIKHGIAPNQEGGELWIRAWPGNGQWSLEVRNDCPPGAGRPGTRTGLANLRERLQLGYGDGARLDIEHELGRHCARLWLPT